MTLRGNHPARIDDKGRIKIPNGFRLLVQSQYGPDLFVTSVTGEYVRLYPMAVWLEIERKLAQVPSTNPRSEEHTSELQSPCNLVCRLLLEKKKQLTPHHNAPSNAI